MFVSCTNYLLTKRPCNVVVLSLLFHPLAIKAVPNRYFVRYHELRIHYKIKRNIILLLYVRFRK